MNFESMLDGVTPKIRQIAVRYHRLCPDADTNDLMSEMRLHLWNKWGRGAAPEHTESYIVQSCYFHVRNYIRKHQEGSRTVPLDEPLAVPGSFDTGRVATLEELVPDYGPEPSGIAEGMALYKTIMRNGFSRTEKDIVAFLCEGYTIREIGRKLNISHAMVIKYKKNICRRVTSEYGALLV